MARQRISKRIGGRRINEERERGPSFDPYLCSPIFPSLRQFPSVNSIICRYTPPRPCLLLRLESARVRRLFDNLIGVLPRAHRAASTVYTRVQGDGGRIEGDGGQSPAEEERYREGGRSFLDRAVVVHVPQGCYRDWIGWKIFEILA